MEGCAHLGEGVITWTEEDGEAESRLPSQVEDDRLAHSLFAEVNEKQDQSSSETHKLNDFFCNRLGYEIET